jgi:hypothetical protein
MTVVQGEPVSVDELNELKSLRAAFSSDDALKTLDSFATWLFASSGVLGALATAGKIVGIGELDDRGKRYFGFAVLLFGIALALAALARMPQPVRFNPYSALSMRIQLRRIILTRTALVVLAAVAFAAALVLAGFAPLETAVSAQRRGTALTYTVTGKAAVITANIARASPSTLVVVRSTTRPTRTTVVLPQASTTADANGRASLSLRLPRLNGIRTIVVTAIWRTSDGGTKTKHITIRLRHNLPTASPTHKKRKKRTGAA